MFCSKIYFESDLELISRQLLGIINEIKSKFRQRTLNSEKKIILEFSYKTGFEPIEAPSWSPFRAFVVSVKKHRMYHRKVITIGEYSIIIS